jgi:uncharacterized membrane protein (DUF2068 family)
MINGKPFELLTVSGLIILIGSLGLVDIFFISDAPFGALAALIVSYGLLHPLTAFFLWTVQCWALKAARIFIGVSLIASFLYFGRLSSMIIVINALLYLYVLLILFRHDIKKVFDED